MSLLQQHAHCALQKKKKERKKEKNREREKERKKEKKKSLKKSPVSTEEEKTEKEKKSETDCHRFEREKKKNQNAQEIRRTLFNWTKQDKTCKFSWKFSEKDREEKKATRNLP